MSCVVACCSGQVVFWLGVAINLIMSLDYLLRLYDPRCRIYRLPSTDTGTRDSQYLLIGGYRLLECPLLVTFRVASYYEWRVPYPI
jgi:hypothetical protein